MENLKLLQEQIDTLKGISSSKAKIFKLKHKRNSVALDKSFINS